MAKVRIIIELDDHLVGDEPVDFKTVHADLKELFRGGMSLKRDKILGRWNSQMTSLSVDERPKYGP